ncbi:hypothetical protein DFJ73DRAFT_69663 [Zopfochytrium polystomum]|nr:hypothetical protein DFJ73DRAFT_69663 [Zopfochytrium polystomum]
MGSENVEEALAPAEKAEFSGNSSLFKILRIQPCTMPPVGMATPNNLCVPEGLSPTKASPPASSSFHEEIRPQFRLKDLAPNNREDMFSRKEFAPLTRVDCNDSNHLREADSLDAQPLMSIVSLETINRPTPATGLSMDKSNNKFSQPRAPLDGQVVEISTFAAEKFATAAIAGLNRPPLQRSISGHLSAALNLLGSPIRSRYLQRDAELDASQNSRLTKDKSGKSRLTFISVRWGLPRRKFNGEKAGDNDRNNSNSPNTDDGLPQESPLQPNSCAAGTSRTMSDKPNTSTTQTQFSLRFFGPRCVSALEPSLARQAPLPAVRTTTQGETASNEHRSQSTRASAPTVKPDRSIDDPTNTAVGGRTSAPHPRSPLAALLINASADIQTTTTNTLDTDPAVPSTLFVPASATASVEPKEMVSLLFPPPLPVEAACSRFSSSGVPRQQTSRPNPVARLSLDPGLRIAPEVEPGDASLG